MRFFSFTASYACFRCVDVEGKAEGREEVGG
jgi:hypothetical protein